MSKADRLYRSQPTPLADFVFDEQVVEVFDDMIHRSVPGYDTLLGLIAVIAEKHSQAGSRVYDLGCSLGAVTRAIHARLQDAPECYVCIDNSPAMAAQCRAILQRHLPPNRLRVDCRDAAQVEIANAGVVVLNFTLQFIRPDERQAVLSRLYHGMLPARRAGVIGKNSAAGKFTAGGAAYAVQKRQRLFGAGDQPQTQCAGAGHAARYRGAAVAALAAGGFCPGRALVSVL